MVDKTLYQLNKQCQTRLKRAVTISQTSCGPEGWGVESWIGGGILDNLFWKVQNTLADFMPSNNRFLLGLEFGNQTFDAVCGCWKNQCTQQQNPLVPPQFYIDDGQLPRLWLFGRTLRPQRYRMDNQEQKRIVRRWETEVIFENYKRYIMSPGHCGIIIQMERSGCDKHPGTLFLQLTGLICFRFRGVRCSGLFKESGNWQCI